MCVIARRRVSERNAEVPEAWATGAGATQGPRLHEREEVRRPPVPSHQQR